MTKEVNAFYTVIANDNDDYTRDFDYYKDAKAYFESLAIDQATGKVNEDNDNVKILECGEIVEGGEPTGDFVQPEVIETWRA